MSIDITQDGITREWRIGVGDMAREHMALRFSATRRGAIREFNRVCRTKPGLLVDLCLVDLDSGLPCRPYRSLDEQGRVRGDYHGWRPLPGVRA